MKVLGSFSDYLVSCKACRAHMKLICSGNEPEIFLLRSDHLFFLSHTMFDKTEHPSLQFNPSFKILF